MPAAIVNFAAPTTTKNGCFIGRILTAIHPHPSSISAMAGISTNDFASACASAQSGAGTYRARCPMQSLPRRAIIVMRRLVVVCVAALSVAMADGAAAQAVRSTVLGTVSDPTGAVLPGASVNVTNTETGVVQSTVADSQGRYAVTDLLPAAYNVEASLSGFQTVVRQGIRLVVGEHWSGWWHVPSAASRDVQSVQPGELRIAERGGLCRHRRRCCRLQRECWADHDGWCTTSAAVRREARVLTVLISRSHMRRLLPVGWAVNVQSDDRREAGRLQLLPAVAGVLQQ